MPNFSPKIIAQGKPYKDRMLIFWLFVFVLPALVCKLAAGIYVEAVAKQNFFADSSKLKIDAEAFVQDLDMEKMIGRAMAEVKRQSEKSCPAGSDQAAISRFISESFTRDHGITPIFTGLMHLGNHKCGSYSLPESIINPGRRSLEIILTHLNLPESSRSIENAKKFNLISKTVFGNFLEAASRPGIVRSGFFDRGKGDRLFIAYDSFVCASNETKYSFLVVFSENSIGPGKLLKYARCRPTLPQIRRNYAMLPVFPDRTFSQTADKRTFFAMAVPPAALRVGSHTGKSWYDHAIRNGSARRQPSQLPHMLISIAPPASAALLEKNLQMVNLGLLLFVFSGLAIIRQYLTGSLYTAPLNQRFKIAILAATIIPFAAFVFSAAQYTGHISKVIISSQTQNIANDLQLIEMNILNHDLRERQITSSFVSELQQQSLNSYPELKSRLESRLGKLFEGYALLRSDGTYLEHLPGRSDIPVDDFNKLQMVKEVHFSQLYNVFSVTGALTDNFSANASRVPEYVKWKAFDQHFNEVDQDSFCSLDGQYYLSRNAEKNYFRISFHLLFPYEKNQLRAGLMLVRNARNSVERFLLDSETGNLVWKQQGEQTTHSAVFRCYDDGSGLDPGFAWPAGARKDPELLAAAEHLSQNQREACWQQVDSHGMTTIYAARAMSELPFILVSRCLVSNAAVNESLFTLVALLLIPYAMLLISILSSMLADVFLKPISLLLESVAALEAGHYPTIVYKAENELGNLVRHFNSMSEGMRQRQLLQRFISDEVSTSIEEEAKLMHESAGSMVYRVIMFIHIRDFATIIEQLPAENAVTLLNQYFSHMEPCLKRHDGQIDKYIGDAIMVSFSREKCADAPEIAACLSARECLQTIISLNQKLLDAGLPKVLIGIGIACGNVIRGKIGARQSRKDFTLIGDPVNLAARLEAKSHFGASSHILVDEKVAFSAKSLPAINFHGNTIIKGKAEPVQVFEVAG